MKFLLFFTLMSTYDQNNTKGSKKKLAVEADEDFIENVTVLY